MAETLIDFIYQLSGRKQSGSCLLVAAPEVHEEMRLRIQLSAEVTFQNVEMIIATPITQSAKQEKVAHLLKTASEHIKKHYRDEWLWIEPDCVPLKPDWIEKLKAAYHAQPKRYFGAFLKWNDGKLSLARQSIYPPNAFDDFQRNVDPISSATKTYLIQQNFFPADLREESVLFHSDKSGELIGMLRKQIESQPFKRRGRPPKLQHA